MGTTAVRCALLGRALAMSLVLVGGAPRRAAGDDPAPPPAVAARARVPFIIGAPDRLDSDRDRRYPRFYDRDDSTVHAYADVEAVDDPTWLRQELESYARRAWSCDANAGPCRWEVRTVHGARVLYLSSGVRAELLWLTTNNRAVRLGWRRIVAGPTGTMTVDAPPEEFARAVLRDFPSRLESVTVSGAISVDAELDRLLYYVDRVLSGVGEVRDDAARRRAERFIAASLDRARRLRAAAGSDPSRDEDTRAAAASAIEEIESVRRWRAAIAARPWCAAGSESEPSGAR